MARNIELKKFKIMTLDKRIRMVEKEERKKLQF